MPLTPGEVAGAFEAACRAELTALKPGNVHHFASGHGMEAHHFEDAAHAAAPAIGAPGLKVGERIAQAVEASLAVAGCNTNLGIVLLCAPLAAAALDPAPVPLRTRLSHILATLDREDGAQAFRAIALASPGGLGDAPEADVRGPTEITLRAAMALAAERDLIARQYENGYAEVFALGVPHLLRAPLEPERLEGAYLAFLSAFPDSHVARKYGLARAEAVRLKADALRTGLADAEPDERRARLLAFDTELKSQGLNPGTSADLTVASAFAALLDPPGSAAG